MIIYVSWRATPHRGSEGTETGPFSVVSYLDLLNSCEVAYNHWTGMVEWNGGME